MDIKVFLDQVLQSGKGLTQKGQDLAEQKLGVPAEGEKRDQMLSGMKTGAAAAGALALLLGTAAGRRVTGAAVKVGGLAALGGLAYQMYRSWDAGAAGEATTATSSTTSGDPLRLESVRTKASPEVLLKAMVAAAKADGHVDDAELATIRQRLAEMTDDKTLNDTLMQELQRPLDASHIAALAKGDRAVATEIFLVSASIIDETNAIEARYLSDLRAALQLPSA